VKRFFGQTVCERRVGELSLVDSAHPGGSRLARHSHEHAYFCLNHGGSYSERYGRRERTCHPGMVVFHPPGEPHSEVHHTTVCSLNVEVGSDWLAQLAELGGTFDQPAEFRDDAVATAGFSLLAELDRPEADLAIESLAWEIVAAAVLRRPVTDRGRPRWLVQAEELLEAAVGEPLTLGRVAAEVGVHPVHLAAIFRQFHGCSVGEYLRRRRLHHARRRLADSELPLARIAAEAGFADQSHLTRAFKRFTGMTPGRYRTFLRFKTR
jgi:AraC family transcriptional regulator